MEKRNDKIDLKKLSIPVNDILRLSGQNGLRSIMSILIEYWEKLSDNERKSDFIDGLSKTLYVDVEEIINNRVFHLLNKDEIKYLFNDGVDIQLHSYRHRWPIERDKAIEEIKINQEHLEPLINRRIKHFCYPSGFYTPEQF